MPVCPDCRFDPEHYTLEDIRGTLRSVPLRWEWLVEGLDSAPVADLAKQLDGAIERIDGMAALDARTLDTVHDVTHALTEAGRRLATQRPGAGATGTVAGLFASGGGVPKLPIPEALIGYRGVDGDRQAARQHHGRVWQALCLWSTERVEQLASEGHPIAPGSCGENLSVVGIDWTMVRPGVRIAIGDDVLAEITSYTPPCSKNARWFADRNFNRIDHERHPGWSRVYAAVLRDGVVRPGDPVVLEPR